jgi:hypothetical protein
MKRRLVALAVMSLFLACAPVFGAIATELKLSDGSLTATIDVDTGGVVTCLGSCGGLINLSTGAHNKLNVIGTFGQFDVNFTGRGGGISVRPTLENLNQLNATSTGAGTLTAWFTDTSFVDLASGFQLGISGVNDVQISSSTSAFSAFADAGNGVPAATLIGAMTGFTGTSYNNTSQFANPIGSSGSLTLKTVLAFSGQGAMQANFSISNVPEPASVIFLGTTVLGLSAFLRRKLQVKV